MAIPVYLDYAASSPLRDIAKEAEAAYESSVFAGANPNSLHTLGRMAAAALNAARGDLTRALGSGFRPQDIIFTSGGTESNNLAVLGCARQLRSADSRRSTVLLSSIEHDSVLDLTAELQRDGFTVEHIPASRDGRISEDALDALVDEHTALVSVMAANNETGVIQDLTALARRAHSAGAVFHSDATQGFCKVPLCLDCVDAVSISGHKIGAPVGIGALALKRGLRLRPLFYGGGQEDKRRAGTQDVRSALAFAACARDLIARMDITRSLTADKANRLYARLCAPGSGIHPTTIAGVDNGHLPGIVSILADGLDSQMLVLLLDEQGFEVSAASACSSESKDVSHVLAAMGLGDAASQASLRISFDERVTDEDLDRFADALLSLMQQSR